MNSINEKINLLINKPYKTAIDINSENEKNICWNFCRGIFKLYNIELAEYPHQNLLQLGEDRLVIPCIVLFNCKDEWHSGVLWPDGLHFIHVKFEEPLQNEENKKPYYIVREERLSRWPWKDLLEGYYINV